MKVKYSYHPTSGHFNMKVVPETREEYFELLEFDAKSILNFVVDRAKTELKNSFIITGIEALEERFLFKINTQPVPSGHES